MCPANLSARAMLRSSCSGRGQLPLTPQLIGPLMTDFFDFLQLPFVFVYRFRLGVCIYFSLGQEVFGPLGQVVAFLSLTLGMYYIYLHLWTDNFLTFCSYLLFFLQVRLGECIYFFTRLGSFLFFTHQVRQLHYFVPWVKYIISIVYNIYIYCI